MLAGERPGHRYRRPGLQSVSLSRPAKPADVGADAQLAQLPGRFRRRNRRLSHRRSVDRAGRGRDDRAARRPQRSKSPPGCCSPAPILRASTNSLRADGAKSLRAVNLANLRASDLENTPSMKIEAGGLGRDGRGCTAPHTDNRRLHPGDRRAGDSRSTDRVSPPPARRGNGLSDEPWKLGMNLGAMLAGIKLANPGALWLLIAVGVILAWSLPGVEHAAQALRAAAARAGAGAVRAGAGRSRRPSREARAPRGRRWSTLRPASPRRCARGPPSCCATISNCAPAIRR